MRGRWIAFQASPRADLESQVSEFNWVTPRPVMDQNFAGGIFKTGSRVMLSLKRQR
jgi:hypothetical protein